MGVGRYHYSIDDVFTSLIEVSASGRPASEHGFFAFLESLHRDLDVSVDLYLFRRKAVAGRVRSLAEVAQNVADWLQENPWVCLGPHALDPDTAPYAQDPVCQEQVMEGIYEEIDRLGMFGRCSRWVRLHCFSESYELAPLWARRNVEALLTTDKPAISYRLPLTEREALRTAGSVEFGGTCFVRSHWRVEALVSQGIDERWLSDAVAALPSSSDCVVVFSHEEELARPEVRRTTRDVLEWFVRRGLRPRF